MCVRPKSTVGSVHWSLREPVSWSLKVTFSYCELLCFDNIFSRRSAHRVLSAVTQAVQVAIHVIAKRCAFSESLFPSHCLQNTVFLLVHFVSYCLRQQQSFPTIKPIPCRCLDMSAAAAPFRLRGLSLVSSRILRVISVAELFEYQPEETARMQACIHLRESGSSTFATSSHCC